MTPAAAMSPQPSAGRATAVRLRDVSPRLALQAAPATTDQKIELVDRLTGAGVRAVEVTSFVRPDLVPLLADAEQVFAGVTRRPGVSLECCVGNTHGLRRAVDAGADTAWFLLSVDDGFARDNTGRSTPDSLDELERMRTLTEGSATTLGTYLIAAWGGPGGTARTWSDLAPLADRLQRMGIDDWILADSFGYAAPAQAHALVAAAARHRPQGAERLVVHIHDHRGMGLADLAELVDLGVRLDTSLGGSGGHPARTTTRGGGVCTEDAVQMLELMGVETGVDLDALIDASTWLSEVVGVPTRSFTRRAGRVPVRARPLPGRGSAWPALTAGARG